MHSVSAAELNVTVNYTTQLHNYTTLHSSIFYVTYVTYSYDVEQQNAPLFNLI